MEKLKNKALFINEAIKESELYQTYLQFEKLMEKEVVLKKEEERLKLMQKQIVQATYRQDENVEELKSTYQKRKEAYDTHPLVVSYLNAKEDLNDYLQYLNHYINGALK